MIMIKIYILNESDKMKNIVQTYRMSISNARICLKDKG